MAKPLADMTEDELIAEMDAWDAVMRAPTGPGNPSNAACTGAELLHDEAAAWLARRRMAAAADAAP